MVSGPGLELAQFGGDRCVGRVGQGRRLLVGELMVLPNSKAVVVINERTGTVIIGENVKLSRVLITHSNLSIMTSETPQASQPLPFSPPGATTLRSLG